MEKVLCLFVLNEKHQRKRIIDIPTMKKRFTNISEAIDIDFADDEKTRLDKLKKVCQILYLLNYLISGALFQQNGLVIREVLENDKRNTISLQNYLTICKDNGNHKTRRCAFVLSQYFHDIGVFLHFQDDELLKKTIFLEPNWATNAVYKILDHNLLNQKKGRFNKKDAETIWSEDEYTLIFVMNCLKLMQKFFLTYELDRFWRIHRT